MAEIVRAPLSNPEGARESPGPHQGTPSGRANLLDHPRDPEARPKSFAHLRATPEGRADLRGLTRDPQGVRKFRCAPFRKPPGRPEFSAAPQPNAGERQNLPHPPMKSQMGARSFRASPGIPKTP